MLKPLFRTALRRRLTTIAGAGAILLFAGVAGGAGASAAVTARTSAVAPATVTAGAAAGAAAGANPVASGPSRQAYDPMTGTTVTVHKPTDSTPVHPEKLTHPGKDTMGAVTSSHGHGNSSPSAIEPAVSGLPGIDVSSYQGDVNWASVAPSVDFVYAKATEGTYYTNPDFTNQYEGPYDYGVIRGAYHFGIPNNSGGAAQADYFVANGGGWSADGKTLPGALDIEYNPYGAECYGLSQASMTTWIWDFVDEYAYDTGTYPVIYSTYDWWSTCTTNDSAFASYDPFWIADYSSSAGTLPAGYGYYTFWQYADSGAEPGDQDVFNGVYSRLQALALG